MAQLQDFRQDLQQIAMQEQDLRGSLLRELREDFAQEQLDSACHNDDLRFKFVRQNAELRHDFGKASASQKEEPEEFMKMPLVA